MTNWKVLLDREIIALMIGDSTLVDDIFYSTKMPYMEKKDIILFGKKIKSTIFDNFDLNNSRSSIMHHVLSFVINNNNIDVFFKELFDLKKFRSLHTPYRDGIGLYWDTINNFMFRINSILAFDKCHIEYNFDTWNFSLIDDENEIVVNSEKIQTVNKTYIKRLQNEIYGSIYSRDYESCITKSRTLLEEVLIYGIEIKDEMITEKGDINKLYNDFKTLYNMHSNKNLNNKFNNLLSGLQKIVVSISELRNANSDSHGVGIKRDDLEEYHSWLIANSSVTMCDFLLSIIDSDNIGD